MLCFQLCMVFYIALTLTAPSCADCIHSGNSMQCSGGNNKVDSSDITTLDLSNRGLKKLDEQLLRHYRHVPRLNLSSNPLGSVEKLTSHSIMLGVEYLDLSNTSLISINFKVFAKNRNLKVLILNDNPYMLISPGTAELPSLRELHLQNCGLSVLRTSSFKGFRKLKVLDLQRNKIEKLPTDFYEALPFIESIALMGNPILGTPTEDTAPTTTSKFYLRFEFLAAVGVIVVIYFTCKG